MNKKYIVGAGAIATALTGTLFLVSVHAQEVTNAQPTTTASAITRKQPMVLEVGPTGRVLMRGTVEAVGTNSLTVKSWGGSWVVNIASTTSLAPKTDISQFAAGDFVGVQGAMSASAMWTIDATLVRNWTERKEIKIEKKEVRQEAKTEVKEKVQEKSQDTQDKINAIMREIERIKAQLKEQQGQ